mgnify:CR=1 FL=1
MGLTEEQKSTYIETAKALKGSDRRMFMARVVKSLGRGGQRRAEAELGWNRCTISKGAHELESGIVCVDYFSARGRDIVKCCGWDLSASFRIMRLSGFLHPRT